MRAICIYIGCIEVTTDYWDIGLLVTTSFIDNYLRNNWMDFHNQTVKIVDNGLCLFLFSLFYFIFLYLLISFSIFRTTRVRGYQSCCHISHKLMAKSQDWSRDLGELSRRFENKWCHTTWAPHVDLMDYTWLFRVGCTVASTNHL